MKQMFTTAVLVLLSFFGLKAQTTATDFTANDCNSVSHNLFTELNNGKVVVLNWVMPCSSCISDSKAAYDAAQSFATSNPGKVLYWLSDDAGNTSCASLNSWASTNSIGPNGMTSFGNVGNTINEANYGGSGMPHVVVIGGTDHHIYLNIRNGANDGAAITAAINQALTTAVNDVQGNIASISVFPNPSKGGISLKFNLNDASKVSVDIIDATGKTVKNMNFSEKFSGDHTLPISFENQLPTGNYFLRLKTDNASRTINFTIAN